MGECEEILVYHQIDEIFLLRAPSVLFFELVSLLKLFVVRPNNRFEFLSSQFPKFYKRWQPKYSQLELVCSEPKFSLRGKQHKTVTV
jgi:hypothetical protein